ncbi:MAG: hypothetical protein Q8876_10245 [Bacillota bacterium]|nr:hypothetical protein [Bacillota bacterium]
MSYKNPNKLKKKKKLIKAVTLQPTTDAKIGPVTKPQNINKESEVLSGNK